MTFEKILDFAIGGVVPALLVLALIAVALWVLGVIGWAIVRWAVLNGYLAPWLASGEHVVAAPHGSPESNVTTWTFYLAKDGVVENWRRIDGLVPQVLLHLAARLRLTYGWERLPWVFVTSCVGPDTYRKEVKRTTWLLWVPFGASDSYAQQRAHA